MEGLLLRQKSEHEASGTANGEGSVLFKSVLEDQLKRKDMGLGGVEACTVVVCFVKDDVELPNIWDTSSETVDDSCKNVFLELISRESLTVNLFGCVIPLVGFYGIPVMPITLA